MFVEQKVKKWKKRKDCASETDAPHLYLENHLCYDRKSSLQQGMENLHMSGQGTAFTVCGLNLEMQPFPNDQVLCDILVYTPIRTLLLQ